MRSRFALLAVCFFLSGATGLVYQIVWLRLLGLLFGHTVPAITTVLAAFMAGLGLGSLVLARRVERLRNLIAAYGWLEIGIGISCALVPLALGLAGQAYLGVHRWVGLGPVALAILRFTLVFAVLLVPTTLMGGTLPVLGQALARAETRLGRTVGVLYALNTAGAIAGVALAGYLVIPMLGNRLAIALAAAANLAVGAAALMLARRWSGVVAVAQAPTALPAPVEGPAPPEDLALAAVPEDAAPPAAWVDPSSVPLSRLAIGATVAGLVVSGAVSMVYEVAWTRALALVIGSSTYAFSAMLIAFLLGIAGGSALYSWLWGTRPATPTVFAVLQIGIAVATAASVALFERLPALFLGGLAWSDSPPFIQLLQVCLSVIALLPSTLCIGATFPCAVAAAGGASARPGRSIGDVYAMNTLGAIVGAILGGFALIPAGGVHWALKLGILVNLATAAILLLVPAGAAVPGRASRRAGGLAALLVLAVSVWLLPAWSPNVMASGPAIYGKRYLREGGFRSVTPMLTDGQFLYYRDGPSATVAVYQTGGNTYLRVNGKTDASTSGDMPTQLLSGHLPLLLHPEPRTVLVIGLGSGITTGAVARHPVERIEVAEIEPAVVEASRFFAAVHGGVLADPRVHTAIADGRNHLLTTPRRYDVIISEPSNPWIGGLASLFSLEFFRLARERLQPGGIMLQWLQGYNLTPEDFRMVVHTFRTAFPATTIWNPTGGDYLLMGSAEPRPIDLARLRRRDEDARLGVDRDRLSLSSWGGLLGYFALGREDAERLAQGARLNTDDQLPLEFSAPRALYLDTHPANARLVRSFRAAAMPAIGASSRADLDRADVQHAIGIAQLNRGALADALPHLTRAVELDPGNVDVLLRTGRTQLRLRNATAALALARQALVRQPTSSAALFLAGVASGQLGQPQESVAFLERAVAADPQSQQLRHALTRSQLAALRRPGAPALDADALGELLAP